MKAEHDNGPGREFIRRLRLIRRIWRWGLLGRDGVWLLGQLLVVAVGVMLLDRALALEPRWRVTLVTAVALVWGARWIARVLGIARLSLRQTAMRADNLLSARRQPALSAWELYHRRSSQSGLERYLNECVIRQANDRLRSVAGWRWFPVAAWRTQIKWLFLQLSLAVGLFLTFPNAATTLGMRWLFPAQDLPPYSPYAFTVTPGFPRVAYGEDLDLTVRIDGAPVQGSVWLLTRYEGQVHRVACFQDADGRYAQRIERVVDPLECAFAVGRARSDWIPVELLLQPRIVEAHVQVQPPRYSGLPARRFAAGQEPLRALAGSRIRLELTSNRPVTEGWATIRPIADPGSETVARAIRSGRQSLVFEWILTEPADVEAIIRDVRGTTGAEPLRLRQRVQPDAPPEVVITEPLRYAMATPDSRLPVAGLATDDLGVRRVDWVRSVVGFRDRVVTLGPETPVREFRWESVLDLGPLGVEPGQVLELALEVIDTNPNLLGTAVSEIVRVEIISDEDYARMLQDQTTLNAFVARFRAVERSLEAVLESLATLEDIMRDPAATREQRAEQQAQTLVAMQSAESFYQRLADDFPIFESERELREILTPLVETLRTQRSNIDGHTLEPPERLARTARRAREAFGDGSRSVRQVRTDAETLAALAGVMEPMAQFMHLVASQTELVRRLQRFEHRLADEDIPFLQALGRRQDRLRSDLEALRDAMLVAADKLPADAQWDAWRDSSRLFATLIDQLDIPGDMREASRAAGDYRGTAAYRNAAQAREKMDQLLSECAGTPTGDLAGGRLPAGTCDSLRPTLGQMMAAIMRRWGQGEDDGQGWGGVGRAGAGMPIGGAVGDGYWMSGYSMLNTPVYGPDRLLWEEAGDGRAEAWHNGSMAGRGAGGRRVGADVAGLSATRETTSRGSAQSSADSPPQYRDAIRRYFLED